jgi:DNA-3-methyladenine glycosylase I
MAVCVFEGEYHDVVWGSAVRDDDTELFAQLSLASQQAGISWRIVWNKRHHYRRAFHQWDLGKVAAMDDETDVERLAAKDGPWAGKLIQNRNKLRAIVLNARALSARLAAANQTLSDYLWSHVSDEAVRARGGTSGETVNCHPIESDAYQALFGCVSPYSDALAASLRSQPNQLRFLGSVTLQAFMLQNGLLNGHGASCPRNPRCCGAIEGAAATPKRRRPPEDPCTEASERRRARTSVAADYR